MSDWATYAETGGLVLATVGLAFYTRGLVAEARSARAETIRTREEMTHARRLSMKPHLAFDVMALGGTVGMLLIRNVGNGAGLDVDLDLIFTGAATERRTWAEPSIVPGESHEFKLPEPALSNLGALNDQPMVLHVTGTMRNLDGETVELAEELDIAAWWRKAVVAQERVGGRRKLPGVDPNTWGAAGRT